MFQSINAQLVAFLLASLVFLAGCIGGSTNVKNRYSQTSKAPVPISASQQSEFKKALGFMKKQEYAEAIPVLESLLAKNNQLPGAQINLAIAYMALEAEDNKENMRKAEAALNQAIEVNSQESVAYHQLGLLYRRTGRFADGRKAYERAIKINPDYGMAHRNLGILCDIYMQELECAIDHFEKYQRLSVEEDEQVALWLSDLRRRAGVPEPAKPAPTNVSEVQK